MFAKGLRNLALLALPVGAIALAAGMSSESNASTAVAVKQVKASEGADAGRLIIGHTWRVQRFQRSYPWRFQRTFPWRVQRFQRYYPWRFQRLYPWRVHRVHRYFPYRFNRVINIRYRPYLLRSNRVLNRVR